MRPKPNDPEQQSLGRIVLLLGSVVLLVFLSTFIVVWLLGGFSKRHPHGLVPPNPEAPLPPSPSRLSTFSKAAVCTDGPPCSEIGRDILKKGGSAVDAAVAALFCNGLVSCQSMGLGGGFMMTVYIKETQEAFTLLARDAAPSAASTDMFVSKQKGISRTGGLAVGVPGELRGYWEAWKRFGRLPWNDVVQPTIDLCHEGYILSKHQYDSFHFRPGIVEKDPTLREMFLDAETGELHKPGTLIKPTVICKTLKIIAEEGGDALNNGTLTDPFVEDLQAQGSLITREDMENYEPEWATPLNITLRGGETIYSVPPPASGAILSYILKILDGYEMTKESVSTINQTILTIHRVVEAFKFGFAKRTELGDPMFLDVSDLVLNLTSDSYASATRQMIMDNQTFNNADHYGAVFYNHESHGTAHISVLSEDGDAVSVTSTINLFFGAGFSSAKTGIIPNSAMDDFSVPGLKNFFGLPPSPNNFIKPGKRPISSACPTIIVNSQGDVQLVIGASGGTRIISAAAWAIMRFLWFEETIKEAVDASRFHHQLSPMKLTYEYGILQQVIKGLEEKGHKTHRYRDRGSIICAIAKIADKIFANADFRKGGEVYGY